MWIAQVFWSPEQQLTSRFNKTFKLESVEYVYLVGCFHLRNPQWAEFPSFVRLLNGETDIESDSGAVIFFTPSDDHGQRSRSQADAPFRKKDCDGTLAWKSHSGIHHSNSFHLAVWKGRAVICISINAGIWS